MERGILEPAPAAADSRSGDRLHGAEPGRAGEDPFQIQAGRLRWRLAGRGQSPPGVLYQSFTYQLPLPRYRLQQQRRLERDGRIAEFLYRAGILSDGLVSHFCAGLCL